MTAIILTVLLAVATLPIIAILAVTPRRPKDLAKAIEAMVEEVRVAVARMQPDTLALGEVADRIGEEHLDAFTDAVREALQPQQVLVTRCWEDGAPVLRFIYPLHDAAER